MSPMGATRKAQQAGDWALMGEEMKKLHDPAVTDPNAYGYAMNDAVAGKFDLRNPTSFSANTMRFSTSFHINDDVMVYGGYSEGFNSGGVSRYVDSQGEVTVRLQHGGRVVNGVGADPDIVVASAKAYLSALNKLHSKTERVAAQG